MEYFERRRPRREAARPAPLGSDPADMPQPDRGIAEVMIKLVERDLESGTAKDEWLPDEEQLRSAGRTIGEFGNTFLRGYQLALLRLPTIRFLNHTSSRSKPN